MASVKLTISLLCLSKVALTNSAPRAKPRVSSVFPMQVCQRGVHDCIYTGEKGTKEIHIWYRESTHSLSVSLNWCNTRPSPLNSPFWCHIDSPVVCPGHSRNVGRDLMLLSAPDSKSCSYSANYSKKKWTLSEWGRVCVFLVFTRLQTEIRPRSWSPQK